MPNNNAQRNNQRRNARGRNPVANAIYDTLTTAGVLAGLGRHKDSWKDIGQPRPKKNKKKNLGRSTTGSIPSALTSSSSGAFGIRMSGSNTIITGKDILSLDSASVQADTGVFGAYPANPIYWTGTRLALYARQFSQYRPLNMRVTYKPAVGTTTSGTVYLGTFFAGSESDDAALSRTLYASNGGVSTQAYAKATSNITLHNKLTQRAYPLAEGLSEDTSPFTFVAAVQGFVGSVAPGQLEVEYTYEFINPTITKQNFTTLINAMPTDTDSTVTLISTKTVPSATKADAYVGGVISAYHDGSSWQYSANGRPAAAPSSFFAYVMSE